MNGERAARVLPGAVAAATWVLTEAAPWVAGTVMPDYNRQGLGRVAPGGHQGLR